MAYHPNNTPPKYIRDMYSETDCSNHEDSVLFESKPYKIISKEYYYALHKEGDRDDKYIIIRDCSPETAKNIVKGLSMLSASGQACY